MTANIDRHSSVVGPRITPLLDQIASVHVLRMSRRKQEIVLGNTVRKGKEKEDEERSHLHKQERDFLHTHQPLRRKSAFWGVT